MPQLGMYVALATIVSPPFSGELLHIWPSSAVCVCGLGDWVRVGPPMLYTAHRGDT